MERRSPRRPVFGLVVLAVAGVLASLAPAPPAGAAGTTVAWSTLANGQHVAFEPIADVVNFDDPTIDGSMVRATEVGTDLAITVGAKTIYLDDLRIGQLRLQALQFNSAKGASTFVVGDGTYVELDTDGRVSSIGAGNGFTNSQFISLGGPTAYIGGVGADRFIGAPPVEPLNHLSRTALVGSPTATHVPSISGTGAKVAFEGGWTGFGSANNSATDIIVRDVAAGTFTQEHRTFAGTAGLSGSASPRISADGNFVVFTSSSQLVSTSTPSNTIYKADTRSNAVGVVSSTTGGGAYANGGSSHPDVSADGRYVVFLSAATNLASGSAGIGDDVFLKDTATGSVTRVSTSQSGADADADAVTPQISDDGSYVVFASAATNLTTTETGGGATDVYRWTRNGGALVNLTAGGTGSGSSRNPDVASNSKVVFESDKSFVAADTDANTDVYQGDGTTFDLVSQTATGGQIALASGEPSISSTGRWVAFRSFSDALVPGDTNGVSDVFVKDRTTGEVALLSRTEAAQANQASSRPTISSDGRYVAFESGASNLSALDGNGTGSDVFAVGNPTVHATLQGKAGNDRYVVDPAARDTIVEVAGEGTDILEPRLPTTSTLPTEVENFVGTPGDDRVHGNASNNRIDPGAGNDYMYDSAGNDTYVIDVNTDNLTTEPGAGGTDTIESPLTWTLQSFLENLTLTGSAAVNGSGNNANNVLTGNGANNVLDGAGGTDTYTGGGGADAYVITSSANVDVVTDFAVGTDKFRMRQSAWQIGDRDLLVEGATNRTGPGGFSAAAEYVVISKNLTSITMTNASAAIGSATSNYAIGARRVFMVDNGTSSQLLLFIASNGDAKVSASELKPLMTFRNRNAMSVRDLAFVN